MTTVSHRESAKIYAFPDRLVSFSARAKAGIVAFGQPVRITELASRRVSPVVDTSGWYHEAAIKDAERELKNPGGDV